MLKSQLKELLLDIKSECSKCPGGMPYSDELESSFSNGKLDLAEDILAIIDQHEKKSNKQS